MGTLEEHLVPDSDDPVGGNPTFVSGTFMRPGEPVNPTPSDDRSPLLVGNLVAGGVLATLFADVVVQTPQTPGTVALTTVTIGAISTNRGRRADSTRVDDR